MPTQPAKNILNRLSQMSRDPYLHELDDFLSLLQIISDEKGIIPQLVEKDY